MNDKTSARMFLHRAGQAKSAVAFIEQYRAWMEHGKFADLLSPILSKIDKKELFPTPALAEIQKIVLSRHLSEETEKLEAAQAKREAEGNMPKPGKNYLARIYDPRGNELDYKPQYHQHDTDAIRWCDRKLVNEEPGSYGEVANIAMFDGEGNPLTLIIHRGDALSRLFKAKKSPVVQRRSSGMSKPLTWHAKVQQTRSSFSRG